MSDPCLLENATECCVYCWVPFGGEDDPTRHVPLPGFGGGRNYLHGPVYHAENGTTYECVAASPPGTPLAHPACYREWAEAANTTDHTLDEFARGGKA